MRIINTIPFESQKNIVGCYSTDFTVVLLSISGNYTNIVTLEPDSLKMISSFPIEMEPHRYFRACVDDSCIYVPNTLGQVIAVDRFSGEILTTINLSMPLMSNLAESKDKLYCVVGVPISRKNNLITDKFSACIFNKETGEKEVQTNYFSGSNFHIKVDDFLIVLSDTYLIRYSLEGMLSGSINIPAQCYQPILTEKHVILTSKDGHVRVLNRNNLSLVSLVNTGKSNLSGPKLHEDEIFWFTENSICCFKLADYSYQFTDFNTEMKPSIILSEQGVFGFNNQGHLIKFDISSKEHISVKLSETPLIDGVYSDRHLIVLSENKMHLIEA